MNIKDLNFENKNHQELFTFRKFKNLNKCYFITANTIYVFTVKNYILLHKQKIQNLLNHINYKTVISSKEDTFFSFEKIIKKLLLLLIVSLLLSYSWR